MNNDPIRVLHCVVGMNRGGLETFTMNLYRHIDREKIQFDFLVSLDGGYDEEIRTLGGIIYKIDFIDKIGPFSYAKNLRAFFYAHPEYKIVHIQMDKFGGLVAREAKKCRVPVRIIHSHSTKNEGNLIKRSVKNFYGRFYKDATHYAACGEEAARWMFGEDFKKAYIIKNSINLPAFSNKDMRKSPQLTVGHIGRFTKVKNHDFLIDVFEQVLKQEPDATLLLIGDGPERKRIKEKVDSKGLSSSVDFLGIKSNIDYFLQRMDVVCMPSFYEGLPITLIEAQAAGVPCLVSDTITKEANISGDVEYLSLLESPASWANHIVSYKGLSRKDNHPQIQSSGYDITKTAKELENFYLSLI